MVKRGEAASFSENYPQFFKVFLPNKSSQQLQIPPEFVKCFNGVLPYNSTIASLERRSWQVELNKVNDYYYFHGGWHQFVLDNSLELGDFLIFYYGGNAKFYVKIYGKNGCLKEPIAPTSDIHAANSLPEEDQTFEHRKSKRLACTAHNDKIAEKILCSRIPKEDRARKKANKFMSEYPFFKVVLWSTYADRGPVNIPSSFVRSNIDKESLVATLMVSDKSWPVRLVRSQKTVCMLSQGWHLFRIENKLKAGDVCVFELVERNDFVLKVSVFRYQD